MNLMRALARTMLASYFVVNGAKALKDPAEYAPQQEQFAGSVVPLAKKVAPPEVAASIPQDAESLARIAGGMQVAGGLGMIFGKGRRFGAGMIAASMLPQLMSGRGEGDLLKNVALVGGALIAAGDTEGRPSLAWRAQDQASRISRSVEQSRKQLEKNADLSKRQMRKQMKQARKNAKKRVKELSSN